MVIQQERKKEIVARMSISIDYYRPNYACRRVFTDEEEVSIAEYAVTCSRMNFGLPRLDIRKLAYDVAVKNVKTVPSN